MKPKKMKKNEIYSFGLIMDTGIAIDNLFSITNQLRFLKKENEVVLQQLWQNQNGQTEWRDVPVETL